MRYFRYSSLVLWPFALWKTPTFSSATQSQPSNVEVFVVVDVEVVVEVSVLVLVVTVVKVVVEVVVD